MSEAEKWMSGGDYSLFCSTDINDFEQKTSDLGILREYKKFEECLRGNLALLRQGSLGKSQELFAEEIKSIVSDKNPLDAENRLLELRWEFIETKEIGHNFDLELLILYYLKLQILERLFTFDKEKGVKVFDSLCEVALS